MPGKEKVVSTRICSETSCNQILARFLLVKSATKGLNVLYNPLRERTPVRLSEVLLALPAKLKEQVKAEFSKPITAVLASGKPETKDDLLVREQMDRAETFELQQAFDDYCWSFKRKWSG